MFPVYTRTNPTPLTEFGSMTAGFSPYQGTAVTRAARATPAFLRQVQRRYRQVAPEWGMLGGTVPTLPAPALSPVRVKARINGQQATRFRRPNLPPDYIATVGPGLTARPPFVGAAYGPRFTGRDLVIRKRRYEQIDPWAAMSGLTAPGVGSFRGAKNGFLTIQPHRSFTNFQVTPHRAGSLTVQ